MHTPYPYPYISKAGRGRPLHAPAHKIVGWVESDGGPPRLLVWLGVQRQLNGRRALGDPEQGQLWIVLHTISKHFRSAEPEANGRLNPRRTILVVLGEESILRAILRG